MTVILIVLDTVALITCIASTSRQVWAFARDKGFPFSGFLEHVSRPGRLSSGARLTSHVY